MTVLSSIKIPEKVYVGFQGRRYQDEVPLGFMTPYTDDKAGEKRRTTVDNWAKGYGGQKSFNSVILENKPMIGFKIGRAIRRYRSWSGSGASKVRIEDPRGFELEITIENLVMLMEGNLIEDGVLVGECVWGRDGGDNILLPLNSEPYRHSVTTKAAISSAISLRECKPGDRIKLITGEEGIYFGGMYPIGRDGYGPEKFNVTAGKKRYVLKITDANGKVGYHSWASIKVGDMVEKATKNLTAMEMETEIAAAMAIDSRVCVEHSNGFRHLMGYSASDEVTFVKTETVDVTEPELKNECGYTGKFYDAAIFVENNDGGLLESNCYYNFTSDRHANNRGYHVKVPRSVKYYGGYDYKHVLTTGFIGKLTSIDNRNRWHSHGEDTHFEEADVKRFFVVKETFKTKLGLELSTVL